MRLDRRFLPYGVAIATTAIALLLSLWLEQLLSRTIGSFFYVAIVVSAWYGGFRAGFVTVILSSLALNYYFFPPINQFRISQPEDILRLGFFLFVATIINLLTSNFRDSKKKVERLNQQLVQENTEQLRMALSAARMGMWDWNIVTSEITWSPEHALLFGLSSDAFDGKYETFNACIHPDDRFELNQVIQQALQTKSIYQHEFRVIWQDGNIHWLEGRGHGFYNDKGEAVRMTGTIVNIDDRKQIEIVLQENEQKLQLFIKYAPASIAMFDREMCYIAASQRWVDEFLLNSTESLVGRSHYELFPNISEQWKLYHQSGLAGTIEKCDEDFFRSSDGSEQWLRWEIHPWYRSNGDIGGIILFTENITDRKQAQIVLQQLNVELEQRVAERTGELTKVNDHLLVTLVEKENAYKQVEEQAKLLDLAHDSIITWDFNSVITFWNQGAEFMYGWTKAEACEQASHTLLKTQFPQPFDQIQAQLLAQGYWEGELIHVTKDDRTINVSSRWVVQKDDAGTMIKILEINNDITDRKQAELALQQYINQVEDLYNQAPCGYHSLDAEGTIIRINDTELNWLGYDRDEVVNKKNFLDLLNQDSKKIFHNCFPLFKQQGWIENLEFEMMNKDGSTRWISLNASALKDDAGNLIMSRSSLFDISDHKQIEAERRQAELDLKASEESRRLALDLTNTGFWDMDVGNKSQIWNDNLFKLLGFDNEREPTYQLWRDRVHPEEVDWVEQRFLESLENRTDYKAEYRVVHPDGSVHWILGRGKGIYDKSGQAVRSLGVLLDISDRKQAEAVLLQKSQQEKLLWSITQTIRQSLNLNVILNTAVTEVRQTLQTDRTAVYRFNLDWSGDFVVESVGEDWVKLLGCNIQKACEDIYLQETQGGRFRNHESFVIADIGAAGLHPCHVQLLEQFQAKAYMAVPIFSGELLWGLLIVYQNSTPRNWQSWEIELLEQIASQLAIAIQQSQLYEQLQIELQERQQAEATIREAERRWRSLLDNVQLIVVGLDRSGNVNYVNPFFLTLTGYTYSEVFGKNWFNNFLPRASQSLIPTVLSEALIQNEHPYYRNSILTKSGDERFIAWNNTTLQDSESNIIGNISIGEDITERKKVEEIKDEFIGIVSHELRTPLTAIQMSLGLIKTGVYDKKPEKARRMIEIALLDTNRLVNLVNDILDLERLDSGRAIVEKTLCKAADLMQQAVDGIQAIATQHQISLIIIPTDAEVEAAADAIVQTLTNFLSNAIKFSPTDSTIVLSVEHQTDYLLFQVRDRGRGIPANKLELIFGRFQQVDASDAREKGGTGLGLAICQSIIEQHGGKIWAESILGKGSTFCFTLPLSRIE